MDPNTEYTQDVMSHVTDKIEPQLYWNVTEFIKWLYICRIARGIKLLYIFLVCKFEYEYFNSSVKKLIEIVLLPKIDGKKWKKIV